MLRILLLALLAAAPGAQAQMYKCVDARGATQYSDKPCPEGKGAAVDIRGQPPISGKLNERPGNLGDAERDFQRRQIQREREAEAEARQAETRRRNCATLRAQLDTLTRFNVISKVNEKGERVYMDDATRDTRIAQLRAELTKCPG